MFVLGIVLFNFVIGMVEDIAGGDSVSRPFSLVIENVNVNNTCMTIYVGNRLNHAVSVNAAYINDEKREIFGFLGNEALIPSNSTGILHVKGTFVAGGMYNIKLAFNSGNSIIYVVRY